MIRSNPDGTMDLSDLRENPTTESNKPSNYLRQCGNDNERSR